MSSYERFGYDEITNEPFVYDVVAKKHVYGEKELERLGYKKKMTIRVLGSQQTFYEPVPNSTLLRKIETWILKTYEVSVKPCLFCERMKVQKEGYKGFDFLHRQSVKTCIFQTCMVTKMTNLVSDTDDKERFRLVSEKPVKSLAEILELYQRGEIDYLSDTGLWALIEKKLNIKL